MKTLNIYNIVATILLVGLVIYCVRLNDRLNDTENVLNQCETAYYKEIGVLK